MLRRPRNHATRPQEAAWAALAGLLTAALLVALAVIGWLVWTIAVMA